MRRPHYPRKKFKVASGAQIGAKAIKVYVCERCDVQAAGRKPAQCDHCGSMAFIKFDSSGECGRWMQLRQLEHSKNDALRVSNLRRQVRYPLSAQNPDGLSVLVGHYEADFVYEQDGKTIIEDYKGGAVTDLFLWKARHMAAQGTPVTTYKGS